MTILVSRLMLYIWTLQRDEDIINMMIKLKFPTKENGDPVDKDISPMVAVRLTR